MHQDEVEPSVAGSEVESSTDGPEVDRTRRRLLTFFALGINAIAGVLAGVPLIGFLFAPLTTRRTDQWIALGNVDEYPVGETRMVTYRNPHKMTWDGDADKVAAYVRRISEDDFEVMAINCTHLGCPVNWFPESGLFMCPCHGGAYYADGQRASAPPPRELYRYDHRIENGRLIVYGGHLPTLENPLTTDPKEGEQA